MKYIGSFYTWTNKQCEEKRVLSKIDRMLSNNMWDSLFPNAFEHFMPEGIYDDSPCVVFNS